jgi:hypothetical protein
MNITSNNESVINESSTYDDSFYEEIEINIREKIYADHKLGYPEYLDWLARYFPDLDDHESFICFDGRSYISELFYSFSPTKIEGTFFDPSINGTITDGKKFTVGSITYFYNARGVYSISIGNSFECHECVLCFLENKVTIYTTYGGTDQIHITEYVKKDWIDSIVAFDRASVIEQGLRYWTLWGIPQLPDVVDEYIKHQRTNGPVVITELSYRKIL